MIKHVVFDFDGVFTDNKVYINEKGEEMVCCCRADGIGIAKLEELGIKVFILSSESNDVVLKRASKLRIPCIYGSKDKLNDIKLKIPESELKDTVFVGNDINDLEVMKAVGMPAVVAKASEELNVTLPYKLKKEGGEGAVRELCDIISQYRGNITNKYGLWMEEEAK